MGAAHAAPRACSEEGVWGGGDGEGAAEQEIESRERPSPRTRALPLGNRRARAALAHRSARNGRGTGPAGRPRGRPGLLAVTSLPPRLA